MFPCTPAVQKADEGQRQGAGTQSKGLRVEIFGTKNTTRPLTGDTDNTNAQRASVPAGGMTPSATRRVGELQGGTPLLGAVRRRRGKAPYPLGEHILCKAKYNVLYFTIKRATEQVARFRVKYERWSAIMGYAVVHMQKVKSGGVRGYRATTTVSTTTHQPRY